MAERDKKENDSGSEDEDVPARQPTDDDEKAKKDKAVDETSEQSMDGSDPPAW